MERIKISGDRTVATPVSVTDRARSSRRLLAVAAAAALSVLVVSCGGDTESQADAAEKVAEKTAALPEATTFGTVENAPTDPDPHVETEGEVLHPTRELTVHDAVDGEPIARLPVKQISSPTWVPVIEREGDWARILLPARPNGSTGWIDTADGAAESAEHDYVVNVDLDTFNLEIVRGGERIGEWTVGIGDSSTPTPTGRAYIIASIEETVNDYSPIVLPLSYHSESHETFGGGPGTVGIHTWPDNSFVGEANSDGCIRVTQEALDALVTLPLGTIVNIL